MHYYRPGVPCGRPDGHKSRCVTAERLEEQRAWQRQWRKEHPGHFARYYHEVKAEVLLHYGNGHCVCCRTTENLSIDHIHGGGVEHRRSLGIPSGRSFYFWLRANGYPSGYQVMCRSCNSSKAGGLFCRLNHLELVAALWAHQWTICRKTCGHLAAESRPRHGLTKARWNLKPDAQRQQRYWPRLNLSLTRTVPAVSDGKPNDC